MNIIMQLAWLRLLTMRVLVYLVVALKSIILWVWLHLQTVDVDTTCILGTLRA